MRLTLSSLEVEILKGALSKVTFRNCKDLTKEELKILNRLEDYIFLEEKKEPSEKLLKGIEKARNSRTKEAKRKIEKAISNLIFENKKLSVYSVAKEAGVSYNTVNKSEDIKKMIEKNEKARLNAKK